MNKKYRLGKAIFEKMGSGYFYWSLDDDVGDKEATELTEGELLYLGAIPLTDELKQIEELPVVFSVAKTDHMEGLFDAHHAIAKNREKINELVRAVNSLTEERKR